MQCLGSATSHLAVSVADLAEGAVALGDRAVARAELVEIEGEVGARVLALLP